MDVINLPIENAVEPNEEARQPKINMKDGYMETFAETHITDNTTTHKDVLSQPPRGITHKQKLLWLQQRRTEGLWAQCDDCDRWRYLPRVLDRHDLPLKWYCWMNPDKSLATCLAPEVPICLHDEDDLIHAEYAAGSLVLARMPGFPWWPAMVCDDPDTERYYWLDGFSDIPTHYNVVFFDAVDVSRAWMAPEQLMPYKNNKHLVKRSLKTKKYQTRLHVAIIQANDAEKLSLPDRSAKYSFISRYNGKIVTPKKIKRQDKEKYRNMLKRKFHIADFSDESLSSEEEANGVEKNETIKKKNNQKELKKTVTKSKPNIHLEIKNDILKETTLQNFNNTTDSSSLAVQIDSDSGVNKSIVSEASNNVKEKNLTNNSDSLVQSNLYNQNATATILTNEDSEKSDDFEF